MEGTISLQYNLSTVTVVTTVSKKLVLKLFSTTCIPLLLQVTNPQSFQPVTGKQFWGPRLPIEGAFDFHLRAG